MLDLSRVVVGGHSAGGTAALHSSDPGWVPGLRAVFAYGAHTMTATALGHGEATVVAIPAKVPVMLLTGSEDGVIAASRDRYRRDHETRDSHRENDDHGARDGHGAHDGHRDSDGHATHDDHEAHDPVGRTFEEAVGRRRGDSWLVELAGAGHFAVCDPVDTTSGRAFLEPVPDADPAVRGLLGDLIAAFIAASVGLGGWWRAGGAGHPRVGGPLGSTVMGCPPRALAEWVRVWSRRPRRGSRSRSRRPEVARAAASLAWAGWVRLFARPLTFVGVVLRFLGAKMGIEHPFSYRDSWVPLARV